MTGIDYLKALAGGLVLLALNLAVTTGVITVDAMLVEPGHPAAYYQGRAPQIAAWTAPFIGAALMLVTAWLLGRRRPQREPRIFALWLFAAYFLFDAGSGLAFGGLKAVLDPVFAGAMALAMAGALAGGMLARRRAA